MRRTTLVVGCVLFASLAANAQDVTGDMLRRAVEKRLPTPSDRQTAEELLSDWENRGSDDPALQRAFQRIARGSPPAEEQMPALRRTLDMYSGLRSEAEARARDGLGPSPRAAAGGSGVIAASRRAVSGRRGSVLAVGAIGAAVFAGGIGRMLMTRRRRRV